MQQLAPDSGRGATRGADRGVTIGIVTFVVCCLLSTVRMVVVAPTPWGLKNSSDTVTQRSDQRFAALRKELPQRGVVGYVGETGADVVVVADYYLAQYALAPLVVDRSANHPLVVGNFPSGAPAQPPSENLRLVKDFGGGVLLFAAKGSQ